MEGALPSAGLRAVGAAAGAGRLAGSEVGAAWGRGGRGQAAVCAADEDPLTLAWEAATAALAAAGAAPADVGGLWWGCTRPPFAEGPSHTVLATALGLGPAATGLLASGSTHAGLDALTAALWALGAGAVDLALVVASDAIVPALGSPFEARSGAGAVALLLSPDGPHRITLAGTRARPALDRYRGDGERATRDLYDSRLHREAVFAPGIEDAVRLVEAAAPASARPRCWSLPDPDGRLGRVAAGLAGAGPDEVVSAATYQQVGDTGSAAPLLGSLAALAAARPVAVVGQGGGRTSAFVVEPAAPVPGAAAAVARLAGPGRPLSYAEALRHRGQLRPGSEAVPMGVPPGSAMAQREAVEVLQLHGARCEECGTIATPPSVHPACPGCGGPKLAPVELARTGTVHTYVVNHTMPPPFQAPLPLVVVDLDDGARVQLMGDGADDLRIGARVDLVLRRYTVERGVPVYGYKVRADRTAAIEDEGEG